MSIIERIHDDLVFSGAFQDSGNLIPDERYWNCLRKVVIYMAAYFGMDDPGSINIRLSDKPLEIVPASNSESSEIFFPVLVCIDLGTLKNDFQLEGPEADDLNDLSKVQTYADAISVKFGIKKRNVSRLDAHALRLFLSGLNDIEAAKKGFLFSLGHEFGHLYHRHQKKTGLLIKAAKIASFGIYAAYRNRKQEQEADRYSFSRDRELALGGIYLFTLLDQRLELPFSEKKISFLFKTALMLTHSSSKTRKKTIEKHLDEGGSSV